jgi:hypothetical protein
MLWRQARKIYIKSVSERTAEFPINIDSGIRNKLDAMFQPSLEENAAHELARKMSIVSPFMDMDEGADEMPLSPMSPMKTNWGAASESSFEHVSSFGPSYHVQVDGKDKRDMSIPVGFNERVFDAGEKSIKYLVVTNTWRKFVSEGRSSQDGVV